MISFEEAQRIALNAARPLAAERVGLRRAAGLVLASDAASDTDLPPFDRAAMDGYAVWACDVDRPGVELKLTGEVAAGAPADLTVGAGECVRIFTGAPVPKGADAVVMQEVTSPGASEGLVCFNEAVGRKRNIASRGEDVRAGTTVLAAGTRLGAAEVALLAAACSGEVTVIPRPRVAILSTGNELVPPGELIRPGQIRDANGPALAARLGAAGFDVTGLGVARDELSDTRAKIEAGLEFDCLVISGGVSVGDHDLVPGVLDELGVNVLFAGVAMKPGRPLKLGVRAGSVVWGLPGNPVSVLIAAELFVLPVLRRMAGEGVCAPRVRRGVLAADARKKPGRRLFAPGRYVRLRRGPTDGPGRLVRDREGSDGPDGPGIEPVATHGSADLAAYARADVIYTLPADADGGRAGSAVDFYMREGG